MPKVIQYLIAFTVIVFALMYFARPMVSWYLEPSGSVTPLNERHGLDYQSLDNQSLKLWAAHPRKEHGALVTPQDITPIDQNVAEADVFFIHPTTYFGPGGWNSNPLEDGFDKQGIGHVISTAASTFNGCCAIYAPHYRQAHLNAFVTDDRQQGTDALDFAYEDVEDAFEAFLAQRKLGTPFFIASHSQGTLLGARLIRNKVANTPLEQELVAAYLIGYWLPPDTFTRIIPDFPLCESFDDTGCTISYDTYDKTGPGRDNEFSLPHWYPEGWEWRADKPGSCINPLSWKQDQEFVSSDANLGGVGWQGSFSLINLITNNNTGYVYQTLADPVTGVTSAQCGEFNMLMVDTQEGTAFDNPGKGEDKSLHPKDWNLFYMNIRQNITDRLASYKVKNAD
ncbi:MAG: DUF3089 domain-containing protein [Arenicella sp.]|jgi:hypothetical protein|nr:DUF3089 domain-containing protein [Arenicella sp.]